MQADGKQDGICLLNVKALCGVRGREMLSRLSERYIRSDYRLTRQSQFARNAGLKCVWFDRGQAILGKSFGAVHSIS